MSSSPAGTGLAKRRVAVAGGPGAHHPQRVAMCWETGMVAAEPGFQARVMPPRELCRVDTPPT